MVGVFMASWVSVARTPLTVGPATAAGVLVAAAPGSPVASGATRRLARALGVPASRDASATPGTDARSVPGTTGKR